MDPELVRKQLDRIVSSAAFAGADRSSRFLRFVVERALSGRADEIKESVIAVELLGRNPSFDPKTDPIVRAEAARLRTRLETYYNSEGTADLVRIAMPKGGYAPEFSEQKREAARRHVPHPALLLAVVALLGAAAVVVVLGLRKPRDTRDT
jgi:hypothetical protein